MEAVEVSFSFGKFIQVLMGIGISYYLFTSIKDRYNEIQDKKKK